MKKNVLFISVAIMLMTLSVSNLFCQSTSLVINEIFYNPPNSSDDSLEFIELYNPSAVAINIEGYVLKSPSVGTSNINFTFPESTTIAADGYLVIAANSATINNLFNINALQWNSGKTLNNTSKDIVLFNSEQQVIDSVTYYNSAPWPVIPSKGGPSIELLSHTVDNTIGTNWEKSQQSKDIISGQDTLTIFCSPGSANINQRPIADFTNTERIISLNGSVAFTNKSVNFTNLLWNFQGGNITSSQENNPTVTYNNNGMFDVSLYVENEHGNITLTKEKHIVVIPECEAVTELPYETDFNSLPDCWFSYPVAGETNSWTIDATIGRNGGSSVKYDCANSPDNGTGYLYTRRFDVSSTTQPSLTFYYYCPNNQSAASNAPVLQVETFDSDYTLIQSISIQAKKVTTWKKYTMQLGQSETICVISVKNKANNDAVYIDDFSIQSRPDNSFSLTGRITENNAALENILIKIQPGDMTALTDQNGEFTIYVESGWSGTVTPANPQYIYTPAYREIYSIDEDMPNIDFDAKRLPSGWIYNITNNSHTFCIPKSALNLDDIGNGTWIGTFYSKNDNFYCCGAMYVDTTISQCMSSWAANPDTQDTLGFTEGAEIYWKIYDPSTEMEYDAEVEYASGPETFTIDGVTMLDFIGMEKVTQMIIIPKGWSGISSYIVPYQNELETLLENYEDEVYVLMNDDGFFFPTDVSTSTITQWDAEKGYSIKTASSIVLNFTGKVNSNTFIDFPEGWTSFPVKSDEPVSIDSLFGNTDKLDIIKGFGNNEIYVPGVTESFDLLPGKSYKARFNAPYTVNFDYTKQHDIIQIINIDSTPDIVFDGKTIKPTPIDHIVAMEDTVSIFTSDTIVVFSNSGRCFGFGVAATDGKMFVKVYGDDPTTVETDGMTDSEKMFFYLRRAGADYSLGYLFSRNTINYDLFVADGFTLIDKLFLTPVGIPDSKTSQFIAYPNPADKYLHIKVDSDMIPYHCQIIDIMGRTLKEFKFNELSESIDISELEPGMYIIRLTSQNGVITKSIIKTQN